MDPRLTRASNDNSAPALSGTGVAEFQNALGELFGDFDVKVQAKGPSKKLPRKKKPTTVDAEEIKTDADDVSPNALSDLVDHVRTCCECPVCRGPLLRAMLSPCGHVICYQCLGMLFAATQAAPTAAEITPFEGNEVPQMPVCPSCRAPVHRDLYVRCFALDAIVNAAHPDAPKDLSNYGDTGIDEEPSFRNLCVWKAAQDEQLVQQTVKALWGAVKAALPTSTALLLSESRAADDDNQLCPIPMGRMVRGNARYMNFTERPLQTDIYTELSPRIMETILVGGCAEEIARRLQNQGLSLEVFTSRGKRFALVRWPKIPSGPPAADVSSSNRLASRSATLVEAEPPNFEESVAAAKVDFLPPPVLVTARPDAGTSTAPAPRVAAKKSAVAPVRLRK